MYGNYDTAPGTPINSLANRHPLPCLAVLLAVLAMIGSAVYLFASHSAAGTETGSAGRPVEQGAAPSQSSGSDVLTVGGGTDGSTGSSAGGATTGSGSSAGAGASAGHGPRSATAPPAGPLTLTATVIGPHGYSGVCPARMSYAATLTANRAPVDITYRWWGTSSSGSVRHAHLSTTTMTVTDDAPITVSESRSVSVEILAPVHVVSNTVNAVASCTTANVGTLSASRAAYTGDCSRGITEVLSAGITVHSATPGQLTYAWSFNSTMTTSYTASYPAGDSVIPVQYEAVFYNPSYPSRTPDPITATLHLHAPFSAASNPVTYTIWCI